MTAWDDLNARARGLGTHLLGRQRLERLAGAPDLPALAAVLEDQGYVMEKSGGTSAVALELAARRVAAARLRTLMRWAGQRAGTLAVIFEDEDRRSITALVRGAVEGAPAELRLSGLVPTPDLPERALEELARQPTVVAVVALLTAWRHPLSQAVGPAASGVRPDLLQLETDIDREFARRALDGARRAGRRGLLTRYVRLLIDLHNAYAALALSRERDPHASEHWLAGGSGIPLTVFESAAAAGEPSAAGRLLAAGFAGTALSAVFADPGASPAGLERAVLAALIDEFRQLARTDPLSPAPLLTYALRLRAEMLDVRWLVWGVSLGAPKAALFEGLATAT